MKTADLKLRKEMSTLIGAVWAENLRLSRSGLVLFTWGNVSAIDRRAGLVAIKPSGVPYASLRADDIVLTDLDGQAQASGLTPSSDLPTHLRLYRAFETVGAVVHTHSTYATAFAQACRDVPCLGTTHADLFNGRVPVTARMTAAEIACDYEAKTGDVVVRTFRRLRLDGLT